MMELPARGDEPLLRAIAAGQLTHQEAAELQRRLGLLAFNLTVAGQAGTVAKTLATAWLFHLRTRKLSTLPQARREEQALAATWLSAGETVGFLHTTTSSVAFVDPALQVRCCVHFCRSRPFDALLLRLASRTSFREVWRLWANQDAALVERLTALLVYASPARVRFRAARVLSYLADPRTLDPLIAALQDTAGSVRVTAAQALAAIGDPRSIEPLLALLRRENDSARSAIAEALGCFGTLAVLPLLSLLNAPEPGVMRAAVKALGRTGDERAVAPLITLLSHRDRVLAGIAAGALGAMGERAVLPLIQALNTLEDYPLLCAVSALAQTSDQRAAAPLLALLKQHQRSPLMRQRIGEHVRRLPAVGAADVLVTSLQDQDAVVRAWVAIALGDMGDRRALVGLLAALKDEQLDGQTRWSVARTLGKLGDQEAALPLLVLLGDPSLEARLGSHMNAAIIQALGELGDTRAVEPLLQLLHAPTMSTTDRVAQRSAMHALGQLGDARAIEPLICLLQSEENALRLAAIQALGKMGDQHALWALRQLQQRPPTNTYLRHQIKTAINAISTRLVQRSQQAEQL